MSLRAFTSHAVSHGCIRLFEWTLLFTLIVVSMAPSVARAHQGGSGLMVSPTDIAAGDTVTVSGEGFTPGVTLELHLSGPNGDAHLGDVMVDVQGDFAREITIPGDVFPGLYLIRSTGDREASAELSVGAMAGMTVSANETVAERQRSSAWKLVAVVVFLGVAGLGVVIARPWRRAVAPRAA